MEYFEAVLAAAKGKQIVMFLDYDGTLSPIVEDPDSAVMTEEVVLHVGQLPSSIDRFVCLICSVLILPRFNSFFR